MKPFVIPIFITHQGCPHRCIFCDQFTITGQTGIKERFISTATVKETIEHWLQRHRKEKRKMVQVAFYGGSFTGLAQQRQMELLESVQPFIRKGSVDLIRISTRPDYINESSIALLKKYSVTIVELGIQSLDQGVLDASARGHSVQQSVDALKLLKKKGFTVGAQIMCGLPGDSNQRFIASVRKTADIGPDFARIYPALVLRGSGLEKIYREGRYRPLSLGRAVALSCKAKAIFTEHSIRVVRMGLQPSAELATKVVAGPYHPAFGELVIARDLYRKTRNILQDKGNRQAKQLHIAAADESAFRGPENASLKRLAALGLLENVELIFDRRQPRNSVSVQ